jgi:hypothetical protein
LHHDGFIQAMVAGAAGEGKGYEHYGPRAYTQWILPE